MRLIDADEIRIKPEYMHDVCGVAMIRVEDIARILNDMPTINSESERKKGTWILQYNKHSGTTSACFYYFPRCSNCGESSANETNFCPNCGADMRKGGEED